MAKQRCPFLNAHLHLCPPRWLGTPDPWPTNSLPEGKLLGSPFIIRSVPGECGVEKDWLRDSPVPGRGRASRMRMGHRHESTMLLSLISNSLSAAPSLLKGSKAAFPKPRHQLAKSQVLNPQFAEWTTYQSIDSPKPCFCSLLAELVTDGCSCLGGFVSRVGLVWPLGVASRTSATNGLSGGPSWALVLRCLLVDLHRILYVSRWAHASTQPHAFSSFEASCIMWVL